MDAPMNPNMMPPSPAPAPRSSKAGFIVATVILLAVIIAAAAYFWQARSNKASDAMMQKDAAVQNIETQSSSDSASSIKADLNATDVNSVDYDLDPANFTSS